MRLYFLSCERAALKLNGIYMGVIDSFERRIDWDEKTLFAEMIPDGNAQSVNFFIDEGLFSCPPDYLDIYDLNGEKLIYVRKYAKKSAKMKLIWQTRFEGNLITLFEQNGVFLSVENGQTELYEMDDKFAKSEYSLWDICGATAFLITCEGCLCIISRGGKRAFYNAVDSYALGESLKICVDFKTCTLCRAECEYSYDGYEFALISSKVTERKAVPQEIMHFAFFESLLIGAGAEKYLCPDMAEKLGEIKAFLGGYMGVCVPTESFYLSHGDISVAGLIYPVKAHRFSVKYYGVEKENGLISNIFEI